MYAFYGLFLLAQGYSAHQAGLLAFPAADAAVLVKYHTVVRPLLQRTSRAGSGTGRIAASPADHHAKIALNSALRLDLDGAVLQGDCASARPAASEHATQAAYAAFRMGNLQAAALFGLRRWGNIFCRGLKDWPDLHIFYSLDLCHFISFRFQIEDVNKLHLLRGQQGL
jgi:hypothetical protein